MTKWDLFYESKNGSASEKLINIIHCINRIKKQKYMIIWIHAENIFDITQTLCDKNIK